MNKRLLLILHLFVFYVFTLSSQENKQILKKFETTKEVYLKINVSELSQIKKLNKLVYIDESRYNKNSKTIFAYLNKNQFSKLKDLDLEYKIENSPAHKNKIKMANSLKALKKWNSYPTYEQYIELMNNFAKDYSSICKLEKIGTSIKGRDVLVLKISDNVNTKEAEPEVFYSSSMHGDETSGYVTMLHLIDYLLSNYNSNANIKELVDNIEIWINPLSNPDGTYAGGNNTVQYATRTNSNGFDLNRNFPDPEDGEFPGGDRQKETQEMMNFMEKHNFVLSVNFHDGEEVVNYPWDTWSKRHADDSWFQDLCKQYAETVHLHSSNYMTNFNNGITNGYDWYAISGGRQDYINYFLGGREITIELSKTKNPSSDYLPTLWEYNYRSLLNFMKPSLYGICGIISDAETGEPLKAKIRILEHDTDRSEIFSEESLGNYHRMINAGTYNIEVICQGYSNKTINDINVSNNNATILDIELNKGVSMIKNSSNVKKYLHIYPNPCNDILNIEFKLKTLNNVSISIINHKGIIIDSYKGNFQLGVNNIKINTTSFDKGIYIVVLKSNNKIYHELIINI